MNKTPTTSVAADYLISVIKGFLGLNFEVVESGHPRLDNVSWLTSGNLSLQIAFGVEVASKSSLRFQFQLKTKLFGESIDFYLRIVEDSIIPFDVEVVREAILFAESQQHNIELRGVIDKVQLITFELPDQSAIENEELTIAIATALKCFMLRIPDCFGRLPDGSVFRANDDERGMARYVQASLGNGVSMQHIVNSLSHIFIFEKIAEIGEISRAVCTNNGGKLILRARHFR